MVNLESQNRAWQRAQGRHKHGHDVEHDDGMMPFGDSND